MGAKRSDSKFYERSLSGRLNASGAAYQPVLYYRCNNFERPWPEPRYSTLQLFRHVVVHSRRPRCLRSPVSPVFFPTLLHRRAFRSRDQIGEIRELSSSITLLALILRVHVTGMYSWNGINGRDNPSSSNGDNGFYAAGLFKHD